MGGDLEGDVEIVEIGPAGDRSRQVHVGLGSRSHGEASEGPLGDDWLWKDAICHFF